MTARVTSKPDEQHSGHDVARAAGHVVRIRSAAHGCDYTGYTPEQALGDGWSRGVHPEDLARWLDTCVRAFDAREPFEIEYRLRRRDGEYRWVLDRAVPRYADGAVPRLRRRLRRHRRAQAR